MIRIHQIKIKPEQKEKAQTQPGSRLNQTGRKALENKIRKILRLKAEDVFTFEIVKRSIDARKKPDIFYSYTVDVGGLREQEIIKRVKGNQASIVKPVSYRFPSSGTRDMRHRPVIVGAGPAGLFCGYMLALHGYRPLLLERGMDVERRCQSVEKFWKTGKLDKECNVQFGEGGAGTFSDGKLNTLVKDKDGRNRKVLSVFVEAGAPENILYDGKPHIGTDILADVVKNMRNTIIAHGGEIRFDTKVTDLCIEGGRVKAVIAEKREWKKGSRMESAAEEKIKSDIVVLAIGHSARDTFEMLYQRAIPMEAKSFAVGLRVEHPQALIDESQYGLEEPGIFPPASYKVTAQTTEGRGVYSFCMCPGGYVVNASSEEERLAVNGMSYSKRDGKNANSAVIVSVTPKDYGSSHPLAGVEFQRKLEERAYKIGGGSIPVEYYGDFKEAVLEKTGKGEGNIREAGREEIQESICGPGLKRQEAAEEPNEKRELGGYAPQIKGRWQFGKVHAIMPDAINRAFIEGMEEFDRKIPGFAGERVILSGIESRTSSPVRISRNEKGQSDIAGLYPCGEGAGYAGGIMSAAMDGIRMAEQIAGEYRAPYIHQ